MVESRDGRIIDIGAFVGQAGTPVGRTAVRTSRRRCARVTGQQTDVNGGIDM
jgi:hypothetical protein